MYAYTMTVDQPVELYGKVSQEVEKQLHRPLGDGCLVHLATKTATGFRVTEVWESREACESFGEQVMRPTVGRFLSQEAMEQGPPPSEDWEVIRLQVDTANLPAVGSAPAAASTR